jgi:hypothetical protein
MSHLKPGMGELRFLNWAYSFLAGKIRNTSRDFLVVLKEAAEELKTTILEGQDMSLIELDGAYQTIKDVVGFLQHPEFNGSIWPVIEAVANNFDRRVGLTELMYGQTSTNPRSATEVNVKTQGMNIRPDDMAEQVEAWMVEATKKEAAAARYYLRSADVRPVIGDVGGMFWDMFVATADETEAVYEFEYTVASGSTRKPNRDADTEHFNQAMQVMLPCSRGTPSRPATSPRSTRSSGVGARPAGWTPARSCSHPRPRRPRPAPPGGPGGGPPPQEQQGPPQ